jgi:hypothetical protein
LPKGDSLLMLAKAGIIRPQDMDTSTTVETAVNVRASSRASPLPQGFTSLT